MLFFMNSQENGTQPMQIHRRVMLSLIIASLMLVASCAGGAKTKKARYDCSKRTAQAVEKYQKGKYGSVKTMLEDVKLQCAGSDVADTAEYYLAMSLMRMKMYIEAKLEFTRFVQDYPQSVFFEEAQVRVGYCELKQSRSADRDQTETHEALKLLKDFLENYPSSAFADSAQKYLKETVEKLAEKEFNTARFYQKIREREAAVVCYKSFITEYPASKYTQPARLNMAQALIELGRKAEAKEVLDELLAQEKNGDLAAQARALLAKCKE